MMTQGSRQILTFALGSLLLTSAGFAQIAPAAPVPTGTWIGTAQLNAQAVPFCLNVIRNGSQVSGVLVNGKEKFSSSSGSYSDGHLVLHFDYYANTLDATIHDGLLTGTFSGRNRSTPLSAQLNGKLPAGDPNPPRIAGIWEVSVANGAKGERTWKLRVRQNGPEVDAVIERIDGDTGNLYGLWHGGEFLVSHFTAAGPNFAVLRPRPDGTLQLETSAHGNGVETYSAHRVSPVKTAALERVDDPLNHTSLNNPHQPLAFRFPDLDGKLVSNTDPEFAHKVVIVGIGGSWCPNCQDEAPFLEELYRKYHGRGLEIVELSFEEPPQLQNLARLRAVIQRYGITYRVLVAGTPDQLNEKLPNVTNLNCWPTTFFVGRDGLVKAIHTGYAGPATGDDNRALENEMTARIEKLLADKGSPERSKLVKVARAQ
jgi:thiol-disulfide isomerase/thioredoxin